jgi:hypothetical protein
MALFRQLKLSWLLEQNNWVVLTLGIHLFRLKFDLSEFVRKYDYNNAHEAIGAEGTSWLRAVRQMSGEKGVFGLRTASGKPQK